MNEFDFPFDHVTGSRHDDRLQEKHSVAVARARDVHASSTFCPTCGGFGSELDWFFFSSPPVTWQHLCGRAGVMAFCDVDQRQVAFFMTAMN